jgi:hypothetical protein
MCPVLLQPSVLSQLVLLHVLPSTSATFASAAAAAAAGFSRLLLNSFPDDPVLFVTEQGPAHAAAVVLSSDQLTEMQESKQTQDFKALPGIKQMLQVGGNFYWPFVLPHSSIAAVWKAAMPVVQKMSESGQGCSRLQ